MDINARKNALRYQFERIVDPLGYKFSPDRDLVDFCLEQEIMLEQKHGIPYCPCQGLTKDRQQNMKIVCPCIPFHKEHFDFMKMCWCGLYVRKDVTDPEGLRQIPYEEFTKRTRKE
ncbi:MAG TPA: ferredoxin-thioredoxin reductase catalytic domain-containing protein [Methanocella sp.]|nr:ferredoxin-thioredoxin reductase catalytic domain-containing protein [Methanocella sp.]